MYSTLFRIIYIFSTYKLNYLFLKFQIFYEEKYLDRIFQIKEKIVVLAIVPSYHLIGLCSYFSPWIIIFGSKNQLTGLYYYFFLSGDLVASMAGRPIVWFIAWKFWIFIFDLFGFRYLFSIYYLILFIIQYKIKG
jgi:hypothetical protein